ncbi:MAG: bile acid:sodium symporter [Candidatus Hadarchaeales archaeon]
MILLGVAPCTAMVLVWSYLARGNMGHTLVMTAINSLTMVLLYAPLATFLLGVSGIRVPWETIAFSVMVYICTPLVAGYYTRREVLERKGEEWFSRRLVPALGRMAIAALLITLVILFAYQGHLITEIPGIIGMITAGIFANILLVFGILCGSQDHPLGIRRRRPSRHHSGEQPLRGGHRRGHLPLRGGVWGCPGHGGRGADGGTPHALPGVPLQKNKRFFRLRGEELRWVPENSGC